MTASHTALSRTDYAAALIVLVPVALYLMRRMGNFAEALIILGTAALVVFVLPHVPHSPVAILAHPGRKPTTAETDWVMGLAFLLPLVLGAAYSEIRRRNRRGR